MGSQSRSLTVLCELTDRYGESARGETPSHSVYPPDVFGAVGGFTHEVPATFEEGRGCFHLGGSQAGAACIQTA